MRHLDYYWQSNKDWWYRDDDLIAKVKDDAPPEAKESYKHFFEQERNHKSVFDDDYKEPEDDE